MSAARNNRPRLVALVAVTLAMISVRISSAHAFPYSDFFTTADPQHLSVTVFASGIGADHTYGATHEGFALEQTLTPYIGAVARVSAYQIYQGSGWDTPLAADIGTRPRAFGVFMGGIDLLPIQGTSLKIMGGREVGDSSGARIEGDFSSWLWLHSRHPINLAFTGNHFYNNGLSSGAIDVRAVIWSSRDLTWLAGAGGQLWGGDSKPHLLKEFGPDLGVVLRNWNTSIDLQAGYGNLHGYATLGISHRFGWD